jgi:capsid protein
MAKPKRKKKGAPKTVAATLPKITAAAPGNASTRINSGGGIRSRPAAQLWRGWRPETAAQARERVIASRCLQEVVPLLGYLVSQLPEEAIGDGLVPTSESKNPTFKREATTYFELWGNSPAIDIRRRFNFYTAQHLLGSTIIGDGQVFALKIRDGRPAALERPLTDKSFRALQLQFLTRDQIGNGSSRDLMANGSDFIWDQGIQFDALDIPRRYRVLKGRGSTPFSGSTDFDDQPASRMLHIFADRQFNQRHGTPWLFRGSESAFDAIDLKAVKKFAAKIRAHFLGAISTQSGEVPASMRDKVKRGTTTDAEGTTSDNGLRYFELAGGLSLPVLRKNEQIQFFHGQEPLSFAELLKEIWEEAVFCLGYPPEYLLQLAGLGSAATRMILRKVRKAHDRIRRPIREQFCQPVWEFVIGDAMNRGLLPMVDDWRAVRWKGGVDPSIDAGRDEKAEQEKLRTFTSTVEAYCDTLGMDGESVRHGRLEEIADNIKHGRELNLPWFMCIDPMQVQAMTGVASSLGVDVNELAKQLEEAADVGQPA